MLLLVKHTMRVVKNDVKHLRRRFLELNRFFLSFFEVTAERFLEDWGNFGNNGDMDRKLLVIYDNSRIAKLIVCAKRGEPRAAIFFRRIAIGFLHG